MLLRSKSLCPIVQCTISRASPYGISELGLLHYPGQCFNLGCRHKDPTVCGRNVNLHKATNSNESWKHAFLNEHVTHDWTRLPAREQ